MLVNIDLYQKSEDMLKRQFRKGLSKEQEKEGLENAYKVRKNILNNPTEGVYIIENGLNFNHDIEFFTDYTVKEFDSFRPNNIWDDDVSVTDFTLEEQKEWKNNYGICDNCEQVVHHIPQLLNDDRKFILVLVPIRKENQPKKYGWRWHKWGGISNESRNNEIQSVG